MVYSVALDRQFVSILVVGVLTQPQGDGTEHQARVLYLRTGNEVQWRFVSVNGLESARASG